MDNSFFAGGGRSPQVNRDCCSVIQRLFSSEWVAEPSSAMSDLRSLGDKVAYLPEDSTVPNVAIFTIPGGYAIFLSGTNGSLHLEKLVGGWLGTYTYSNVTGASPGFAAAADVIYTAINSLGDINNQKVWIAGHSYGGACGAALAGLIKSHSSSAQITLMSYGAPRPGSRVLCEYLRGCEVYRYYLADDPVRWVPPRCDESAVIHLALSLEQSNRVQQQQQPINGCRVDLTGGQLWEEGAPIQSSAVEWSLFSWCAGLNGFRSLNHAISRYKVAFSAAIPSPPLPPPPMLPVNTNGGARVTLRSREGFDLIGETNIMQAIDNGTAPPIVVPQVSTTDPVPSRYKRKKIGKTWYVRFETDIVGVGPGKRAATKLARSLNQQLRVRH